MTTLDSKKINQSSLISCLWTECEILCDDVWQLNNHISSHLEKCETIDDRNSCPWGACEFYTECFKELQRHLYYHGYYEGLLVRGKYERDINPNIPKCTAPAEDLNKLPVLICDFTCQWVDCQRSFTSIIEFQDHISQHASFEYEIQKSPFEKRKTIQCNWSYCKKELKNKYRLIEHIQTHSNKKYLACYQCGELFRTRTTFFDHLRRQPNNNTHKYQCAQCFKFFATEKLLRVHVVKHVNCFKCNMCDMTCSSASSLATHVRYRHLKDKPFQCTECDHRCVRESDLVKHVQFMHNKEVYRCEELGCNYSVRSYNLLRRHFLERHRNIPFIYICHCCEKFFKNGKSLSSHLIKKHDFQLPSGHKRFKYRIDENGYYRLETRRIQSHEVMKQILSPDFCENSELKKDSTSYEIVSMTNKQDARIIVTNDVLEARVVGEVVISLPSKDLY